MEKVADLIGDEYEKWGARERVPFDNEETAWIENEKCIFISSPTGSGKTYFYIKSAASLCFKEETETVIFGKP